MLHFHYNNYALVNYCGEDYPLRDITKKCKTRTLNSRNGFTAKINVKDIRVSPKTYWQISGYDHQFECNDANCYLCGWYGGTGSDCKCKKSFSVEEHTANVLIARKNFLITVLKNYFKEGVAAAKELTPKEVDSILFKTNEYGGHSLAVYLPSSWSFKAREAELITIKKHLIKNKLLENET